MSSYNHSMFIAVPIALLETARRISRALDPDVGGYEAFQARAVDSSGNEWAVYATPITDTFYANAQGLLSSPLAFFAAVQSDYVNRWQGLTPPAVEEVTAFLGQARVLFETSYGEALARCGLTAFANGDG